ncbi:MAG: hypothetical protein IKK91_00115 [Ruminococcus sp.]|nr:hypothetical protein [Ruminococcus sp.]
MRFFKKAMCTSLAVLTITVGASLPKAIAPEAYGSAPAVIQVMDADAACAVKTGYFNGYDYWTGYTYVYSKNTNKKAKVKICTFDNMGWRSGGNIDIKVYSPNGSCIKSLTDIDTSYTLTLPKGYSYYKIKIKPHRYSNSIWGQGENFLNMGRCVMWSMDAKSNCTF